MKSEDPFGLRPLWDASLGIYREIAKICERHGLRYYVTDGTALGAVRHKGFIRLRLERLINAFDFFFCFGGFFVYAFKHRLGFL